MSRLECLTLVAAADGIAAGHFSSRELTGACLAAARARGEPLNCFLGLDPETALAQAAAADEHLARARAPGPLHGVPLAHKDMFYREGAVTTCGSKIRATFRPRVTATVIERLAHAGAVHLGSLHMSEFATGPTGHNAHYGPCRNPWNPDHITGGSSSGSGAATAARVVFGALGSDTGGSIRIPAAMCGVFGMKGTQTRVSRFGTMGLSFSLDNVGPLARTARDCARLFAVIAGHDPRDPTSSRHPVSDYEAATVDPDVRGLRIGVPSRWFHDGVDEEVHRLLERSLDVFRSLGAEPVSVDMPMALALGGFGHALSACEALALHRAWLAERPQDYGPQVRARYLAAAAVPAGAYLAMVQARARVIREFVAAVFSRCDVLHCPVIGTPVPTLDETDVGDRPEFGQMIAALTRCTRPFNYLGLPALSVPAGFTASGLPAAFQLVGRPFGEARLFRAGATHDRAAQWSRVEPPVVRGVQAHGPQQATRR